LDVFNLVEFATLSTIYPLSFSVRETASSKQVSRPARDFPPRQDILLVVLEIVYEMMIMVEDQVERE
jgi:hypothetical protein